MALNKKDANATVMRERINLLTTQLKDVETALSVSEGALKLADDKVEGMKVLLYLLVIIYLYFIH